MRSAPISSLLVLLSACLSHDRSLSCNDQAAWTDLITAHAQRYPGLEMADVYKLLHQSTMGSEHAVPSAAEAKAWMDAEVGDLRTGPIDPLIDTLGATGRFVRIHLRPFLAARGSPDSLVAAFVETAGSERPDTNELKCALAAWEGMTEQPRSPWPRDSVLSFNRMLQEAKYRSIEHSDSYRLKFAPAYRVVARRLLPIMAPRP